MHGAVQRPMTWAIGRGELGAKRGHVHYRLLSVFPGQHVAILARALTKEGALADHDSERAIRRKQALARDPARHTYEGEITSGSDEGCSEDHRQHHGG
jgi:hypothetical protein